MNRRLILVLIVGVLLAPFSTIAQQIKPFKAGDRVVFTGNSITDGGHFHSYIWLYYMTRMPNMRIDCFNAGIGGDVARQIDERLDDDVFAHHPTVMTLSFGMNDTGYQWYKGAKADSNYKANIARSYQSFQSIQRHLRAHPKVRKVMLGSTPYDEQARIKFIALYKKNEAILQVIDFQKKAAEANKWEFLSFNEPMQAINRQQQLRDTSFTMEGVDRIHPTNDGHMVMAYLFLKAQGLAGKKVADVTIDAETKTVKAENCQVSNLVSNADGLSYWYKANSLPYPVDTIPRGGGNQPRSQADGLKLVPFQKEFNQEMLQIKNLPTLSNYLLKIDGKYLGSYTGAQLMAGINLAGMPATPQYQQALAVMHLNEERWGIERRLREYWWLQYSIMKPHGLLHNDGEATVDSLQKYAKKDFFVGATLNTYYQARLKPVRDAWQKEMDLLTNQIYLINKPVTRKVELTAVTTQQHALTQK
ncbi:SGNH/GDSL hydrolase family protein [Mucilaginibacter achroorhodeus]|uniref:SGNH/GDSL hydrolase family protein n=1 Tax=Mucilaginibacter achroorhodeus TaxID=2599294 RepID=A0A563TZ27_9SPHI|nr:SGNH/GDSL hydrolase family protein [Mucilaginibacter achroorhodeus]TWR24618.1 SGNH/GDSL hydrolase family protein [Mucilaginibacter achroorhodeus]